MDSERIPCITSGLHEIYHYLEHIHIIYLIYSHINSYCNDAQNQPSSKTLYIKYTHESGAIKNKFCPSVSGTYSHNSKIFSQCCKKQSQHKLQRFCKNTY